ncbi:hypothetical protein [Roseibium sp.]|uniref:hypothetical protein n=1 Tax=Roseibium sp. TaxID=1936156 RepID=UPI003B518BCD
MIASAPPPTLAQTNTLSTEQRLENKPVFDMKEIRAELARQYEAWKELPEDQKLRHLKLEKHGLSEQDLDNLPDADRAHFEQKISEATNRPAFTVDAQDLDSGDGVCRPVLSLASVLAISGSNAPEQTNETKPPLGSTE